MPENLQMKLPAMHLIDMALQRGWSTTCYTSDVTSAIRTGLLDRGCAAFSDRLRRHLCRLLGLRPGDMFHQNQGWKPLADEHYSSQQRGVRSSRERQNRSTLRCNCRQNSRKPGYPYSRPMSTGSFWFRLYCNYGCHLHTRPPVTRQPRYFTILPLCYRVCAASTCTHTPYNLINHINFTWLIIAINHLSVINTP